jgi:hypothetical protein
MNGGGFELQLALNFGDGVAEGVEQAVGIALGTERVGDVEIGAARVADDLR